MDGYQEMPLMQDTQISDFIVTATSDKHVVDKAHMDVWLTCLLPNVIRRL